MPAIVSLIKFSSFILLLTFHRFFFSNFVVPSSSIYYCSITDFSSLTWLLIPSNLYGLTNGMFPCLLCMFISSYFISIFHTLRLCFSFLHSFCEGNPSPSINSLLPHFQFLENSFHCLYFPTSLHVLTLCSSYTSWLFRFTTFIYISITSVSSFSLSILVPVIPVLYTCTTFVRILVCRNHSSSLQPPGLFAAVLVNPYKCLVFHLYAPGVASGTLSSPNYESIVVSITILTPCLPTSWCESEKYFKL